MTATLSYAIRYVGNMDRAIEFYTVELGLTLRFQSPFWTEFETGPTTLALHPASADHPAGTCQLGFGVPDVRGFYAQKSARSLVFTAPPAELHGRTVARFQDSDGAECSVGGP